MNNHEKSLIEAAQIFANQFGDDNEFNRILMEIVLEELMCSSKNNYKPPTENQDGIDIH